MQTSGACSSAGMQIQTWYKHKVGLGNGLALWEDKSPWRFTERTLDLYYLLGILNKLEVTEQVTSFFTGNS